MQCYLSPANSRSEWGGGRSRSTECLSAVVPMATVARQGYFYSSISSWACTKLSHWTPSAQQETTLPPRLANQSTSSQPTLSISPNLLSHKDHFSWKSRDSQISGILPVFDAFDLVFI